MGINRFSYLELSLKSGLESFAQEKYFSWCPHSFSFSSVSIRPAKLLFCLFSFFFVLCFVPLDFLCPLSWPICLTDCICWGACSFQISASIHWLLGDRSLWKLSKTDALLHFRCFVLRHCPHLAQSIGLGGYLDLSALLVSYQHLVWCWVSHRLPLRVSNIFHKITIHDSLDSF